MIWRIFFIITAILLLLTYIPNYNGDYPNISSLLYSVNILTEISIAFILGIFYSLGWKKQLFSKKSICIFSAIFVFTMVMFAITLALELYPNIYTEIQSTIIAAISCSIVAFIMLAILNLLLIPFYIGLYKYHKNFDSLKLTNKPYWKLFALFNIVTLTSFFVSFLTKFANFSSYNFIDFFAGISCIYEIIYFIGFAWNVKIFNKLFWQITAAPYMLLLCMTPFFISYNFNQDFHYQDAILSNPISIIRTITIYAIYLFIVYQYAYSKKTLTDISS